MVCATDIGPDTDWTSMLTGCGSIVHLAAHVHKRRDRAHGSASALWRVNVEGTEALARAAARSGVRRFVFLSSIKVNGEYTLGRPFSEQDPIAPVDEYGASKAEAEARLRKIAADTGMEVVILRPPLVYGPGVKANFLSLLKAVDAGLPLPLSSIDNRRSLIYVGNLVSAIEISLTHPAAANRTFLVADGEDVSTPELARRLARSLGVSPRLIPMPVWMLRLAGRLTGKHAAVDRLASSLQVDSTCIRTALHWQPPFTMTAGLTETARWWRATAGK
jgi:nucleoside-diphosphate-sugar epimerase